MAKKHDGQKSGRSTGRAGNVNAAGKTGRAGNGNAGKSHKKSTIRNKHKGK